MSAKLEEIEGIYRGERFRFGECLIGSLDLGEGPDWLTIKGDADEGELQKGHRYRFYGRFTNYRNKRSGSDERQFHFQTFVASKPHNKAGVIEYLARAGKGLGLGPGTAAKLWSAHGPDTIRRVRERPGRIAQANPRITEGQATAIGQILRTQQATEDATIEVTELLAGRGLPKTTARKAIKLWGNLAAKKIKHDPYSLMALRGCGFKLCDALWIELGHSPHRLRRQALCAWHSVASDSNGHVWFPAQEVAQSVRQAIGGTEAKPVRAIKLATRLAKWSPNHYGALAAVRADRGVIVEAGGDLWLAEGKKAEAERDLARMLAAAVAEQHCDWDEIVAYRDVPGHDGYRVSTEGVIESCWSNSGTKRNAWKPLKTDIIKGGYLRVRLRLDTNSYIAKQVSHVVLESFVGECPSGYVACHGDGNPKNNSLRNLRWDTRSNNESDKKQHGTHQTGEGNPAAKLTNEEVLAMRALRSEGWSTYRLAAKFGISRPVVCKIVKNRLWSHI